MAALPIRLAFIALLPVAISRHDAARIGIGAALKAIGVATGPIFDDGIRRARAGAEGEGEG